MRVFGLPRSCRPCGRSRSSSSNSNSNSTRRRSEKDSTGSESGESGEVLDLETVKPSDEELYAADEDLLAELYKSDAAQRRRFTAHSDHEASQASSSSSSLRAEETQAVMEAGKEKLGTRAVSVIDPSLDFGSLRHPGRLEKVGVLDAEAEVPLGRRAVLPQDEDFVTTFRRPLAGETSHQRDPLGIAAPSVTVDDVKQEVLDSEMERTARHDNDAALTQDADYIISDTLKFPKLRLQTEQRTTSQGRVAFSSGHGGVARGAGAGAPKPTRAVQKVPAKMGRFRQAKIEDLSDLMKPVSGRSERSPRLGDLGWVPHPSKASAAETVGLEEPGGRQADAARATQYMLNKRLTQQVRERFPKPGVQDKTAGRNR